MRLVQLLALIAVLTLAGFLGWQSLTAETQSREPLPALSLVPLEGRAEFDPAQMERPWLLNVWGSWCAPCQIEHPVLMALEAEGLPIYGLAWRDTPEAANRFLDEFGDPYRAVMLDNGDISVISLGLSEAPHTFVISAQGEVVAHWEGAITRRALERVIYPAYDRELRRATGG